MTSKIREATSKICKIETLIFYSLTIPVIKQLLDYCLKMPKEDTHLIGYKYPFNACEILCSENGLNIQKFLNTEIEVKEMKKEEKQEEKEEKVNVLPEEKKENEKTEAKDTNEKADTVNEQKGEKNEQIQKDTSNASVVSSINEEVIKEEETTKNEPESENKEKEEKPPVETNDENEKIPDETPADKIKELKSENESEFTLKDNFPLVHQIFNYILVFLDGQPSDDDYVLVGYFNKIVNTLLIERPEIFIEYIFAKNFLSKFMKFISRKAIANSLEAIANSINPSNWNSEDKSNDYLIMFCKTLLEALLDDKIDSLSIESICDVLINSIIIGNKQKCILFLQTKILMDKLNESVDKILKSKEPTKIAKIMKLLLKINETIIKDFEQKKTPNFLFNEAENEINNLILQISRGPHDTRRSQYVEDKNIIFSCSEQILTFENNMLHFVIDDLTKTESSDESFENTYCQKQKCLGMKTLSEWEFFRTIIDFIVNYTSKEQTLTKVDELIDTIINSGIFTKLVGTFFNFALNNMFQNIFSQIAQIVCSENTPKKIVEAFLTSKADDKVLIQSLINDINGHTKFNFKESENEMNSCLFAIEIDTLEIFRKSQNKSVKELINGPNEQFFMEKVSNEIGKKFSDSLMKENNADKNEYDDKDEEIPYSVRSFKDIIAFRLKVYDMYLKKEDYEKAIKEENEKVQNLLNKKNKGEEERQDSRGSNNSNEMESPLFVNPQEETNEDSGTTEDTGREAVNVFQQPEIPSKDKYESNVYWKVKPKVNDDEVMKDLEL